MKPYNILLVEDDLDDQLLIDEAFQGTDVPLKLEFAGDGAQALKMLERPDYLPDLILLDLNMPVMNGFEVLTYLKNTQTSPRIPVVVLTTSSDEKHVNRSYDLGASSFIVKPKNFLDLEDIANNLKTYWFKTVSLPQYS